MMTMVGTTRHVLLLSVSFVSCTSVDGLFSRCLSVSVLFPAYQAVGFKYTKYRQP